MKMKKENVYALNQLFTKLKTFGGTKFKYSILRNLSILESQVKPLLEIEESLKAEISGFDSDRIQLISEIGTPKEDGTIFIDPTNENMFNKFKEEMEKLVEKHKDVLDSYNKKESEFLEILKEPIEGSIEFRKIDIESCPEDGITSEDLELLIKFDIIKE